MKQFFTLALIAGACIARLLSGTMVMKRLIVVAMLAGLMSSAARAETLAQQRAMMTPQQAAVALKSSQEYLRAAGWQFQAMGPDGSSTWINSDYGTVTLAKDGWLQLTNGQKVRPERVGLYLQGLVQGTITPAPSAARREQPPVVSDPEPVRPTPIPTTFAGAVTKCRGLVRQYEPFDAFVLNDGTDNRVSMFGTAAGRYLFGKCMNENGRPLGPLVSE